MHKFRLTCKRMFLSHSPAKVYSLLFRHKTGLLKTHATTTNQQKKHSHPLISAAKFVAEVAFFSEAADTDTFPEELRLDAGHIADLLETLRYEESKEVDLLEQYIKMLLSLHPRMEKTFVSQLSIFETCAVLIDKQTYPS